VATLQRACRLVHTTTAPEGTYGNTESFVYDENLRVTSRLHNGATVETYVYDGPNVEALLTSNGRFTMTWLYDGVDSPLRVTQPQATGAPVLYYELGLAGNVRRLRAPGGGDNGGYRYSAFGVSYPADSGTPALTARGERPPALWWYVLATPLERDAFRPGTVGALRTPGP